MKKILIFSFIGLCISFCVNAQPYYNQIASNRIERELNYICSTSIGAVPYSQEYADCRLFYDKQMYQYGIDVDYITPAQITVFLNRSNPIIRTCRNQGLVSQLLWGCIQTHESHYFDDWARQHPTYRRWDNNRHQDWKKPRPSSNHKRYDDDRGGRDNYRDNKRHDNDSRRNADKLIRELR